MQDMKSVVEMMAVSVLMLLSTALYAQDKIYFNDAAPENADIREIGDDYVLYRQWGSPDGPDYRASLSRVYRIVFRDGTERVFSGQSLFGIDAAGSSPMVICWPGCRDSASCDRKPQARCLGGQLQQPARIRNEICQTCSSVFGMLHQRSGTGFQFLNVW